jgi:hypothetical protein
MAGVFGVGTGRDGSVAGRELATGSLGQSEAISASVERALRAGIRGASVARARSACVRQTAAGMR